MRCQQDSLSVEYRQITTLKPLERNPRTHSSRQIQQIADSIAEFGFTNPILLDANDQVLAGHGRLAAAKVMGLPTVPIVTSSGVFTVSPGAASVRP